MISTVGPLFWDQSRIKNVLRFAMSSRWTCHRPKKARKRRSAGLCPPHTVPSAKLAGGPAFAL